MTLSNEQINSLVLTPEREIKLADDIVKANADYLAEQENLKYVRFMFLKSIYLAVDAGFTRKEVADILEISRQRVSLLLKDYEAFCGREGLPIE